MLDIVDIDKLDDEGKYTENGKGWRTPDGWAAEVETCEFLYGLVRLMKPRIIVEGGSGLSTKYIQRALDDNAKYGRKGKLISYETSKKYAKLMNDSGCDVRVGTCIDYDGKMPDMVFLDTEVPQRTTEFDYWYDKPVLLVMHDAHRTDLLGKLPDDCVVLDNPRGLWMRNNRPHQFLRK